MSSGKPNALEAWVTVAGAELGLAPGDEQTALVLDLARDVAHGVLRPGAPVTAYLLGVAVGRGADPAEAARRLSALALAWRPAPAEAGPNLAPAEAGRNPARDEAGSNPGRDDVSAGPGLHGVSTRPGPDGGDSVADPPAP